LIGKVTSDHLPAASQSDRLGKHVPLQIPRSGETGVFTTGKNSNKDVFLNHSNHPALIIPAYLNASSLNNSTKIS
jgi:hypothetical protein